MERYPHKLHLLLTHEAKKDSEGNFEAFEPEWEFVSECREEPNGSGRLVALTDGSTFQYSSIVFLPPLKCQELISGTKVKVVDAENQERLQGTIARFVTDRKNARLWV